MLSGGLLSALHRPGHPQRVGPPITQIVARGLASTGAMVRVELLFLFVVPLLAMLIYVIVNGKHMAERDIKECRAIVHLLMERDHIKTPPKSMIDRVLADVIAAVPVPRQ